MKQHFLLGLLFFALLAACKREDDDDPVIPNTPEQTCRIVTAVDSSQGNSGRYALTYNGDGKISTISFIESGGTLNYSYSGSNIYVSDPASSRTDTAMMNSNGLLAEYRAFYPTTQYSAITTFEYNGTEVSKRVFTQSSAGDTFIHTTIFTWSGGNLVRAVFDSGLTTDYTYYTDRVLPAAGGDILQFHDFTAFATPYIRNKNPLKSYSNSGDLTTITPVFNANGTFASITYNFRFGGGGKVRYDYSCQ